VHDERLSSLHHPADNPRSGRHSPPDEAFAATAAHHGKLELSRALVQEQDSTGLSIANADSRIEDLREQLGKLQLRRHALGDPAQRIERGHPGLARSKKLLQFSSALAQVFFATRHRHLLLLPPEPRWNQCARLAGHCRWC
jgi:hypothetical protein